MKAYASTVDLKNKCVDPRFKYVTRGCAEYVEWLGQKEIQMEGDGQQEPDMVQRLLQS